MIKLFKLEAVSYGFPDAGKIKTLDVLTKSKSSKSTTEDTTLPDRISLMVAGLPFCSVRISVIWTRPDR
jgi:hypothetical protein